MAFHAAFFLFLGPDKPPSGCPLRGLLGFVPPRHIAECSRGAGLYTFRGTAAEIAFGGNPSFRIKGYHFKGAVCYAHSAAVTYIRVDHACVCGALHFYGVFGAGQKAGDRVGALQAGVLN